MPSILNFLLTAKSHPDTLTLEKQIPGSHIIKRRHNMAKVTREMVEKTGINVDELVQLLVNNAAAVRGYTHICNLTAGKDHRTYDLSQAILNEEIEHESWFSEFLGEGPSGHFLRRGETSPFVSKFLR